MVNLLLQRIQELEAREDAALDELFPGLPYDEGHIQHLLSCHGEGMPECLRSQSERIRKAFEILAPQEGWGETLSSVGPDKPKE